MSENNDKVIAKALELAHAMMEDERFVAFRAASLRNDSDAALQKLIGDFNVARMNLNRAARDEHGDPAKSADLQEQVKKLYSDIMETESMKAYNGTQESMNRMVKQINAIIAGTLDGQVPEDIDLEAACTGDCSTCGGCH